MTTADVTRDGSASRSAIHVEGLTKRFGSRTVVDRLDVAVPTGVVCGLVGPNGAGKTTTLRMLLGLITPSAGAGHVLGEPLAHPERYLGRVGALIESPAFYPGLSAHRNLEVFAIYAGLDPAPIDQLLERVELLDRAHDQYHTYSHGMKQRLGIAASLLGNPELLVLDEPTNGLDPAGIREMRGLVGGLHDGHRTVVVSSHLLTEVQQVCDWLVVIHHGTRIYQGPTGQLLAAGSSVTLRSENPADTRRLAEIITDPALQVRVDGDRVEVRDQHADPTDDQSIVRLAAALNRAAAAHQITLVELIPARPSLEDRYLSLVNGEAS
jgi:ABC-2 type transport system ATP-binding protein